MITSECRLFECGYPQLLSGSSGCDLYNKVFLKDIKSNRVFLDKSKEYWLGYYLAYFQWRSNLSFERISKYISIEELMSMYNPYHEMDLDNFYQVIKEKINKRKGETNLLLKRQEKGYSRNDLSAMSNVPIRTLEQYEQGRKNINHANAEYIVSLSKALSCPIEDLLELE